MLRAGVHLEQTLHEAKFSRKGGGLEASSKGEQANSYKSGTLCATSVKRAKLN